MGDIYVYFSRPNDIYPDQPDLGPVKFGPFQEFVQLTYNTLRVGPNGDTLAWIDRTGVWRVRGDISETEIGHWYSDVVITEINE